MAPMREAAARMRGTSRSRAASPAMRGAVPAQVERSGRISEAAGILLLPGADAPGGSSSTAVLTESPTAKRRAPAPGMVRGTEAAEMSARGQATETDMGKSMSRGTRSSPYRTARKRNTAASEAAAPAAA